MGELWKSRVRRTARWGHERVQGGIEGLSAGARSVVGEHAVGGGG